MYTSGYKNLITSVGKNRLKFLSNPGYKLSSGKSWIAMYVPQFHQIWLNPFSPKQDKNKALIEEFCHNNASRGRPMQLLPIFNWLDGNLKRPDIDDFRDIAEATVIAVRPLIKGIQINKRHLPRSCQYRNLGARIIDLADKFSKFAKKDIDKLEAKKQALWAVITCLHYIIPLKPDQCPNILAFMEKIKLHKEWKTGHDLFEILIYQTSKHARGNKPSVVGFTITRPNDPHILILNLLQIMDSIDPQQHTIEIISSIFPASLYLLTLGNSCLLPIYWLKAKKHKIELIVEIWHQTHEQLKVIEDSMDLVLSNPNYSPTCGARKAYHQIFEEVKKYCLQPIPFNPYDLFEYMLDVAPAILSRYLHNHQDRSCSYCNSVFYNDKKSMRMMKKFIYMSKPMKSLLINSSKYYTDWLLNSSVDQIDYYLRKDFNNRLPIQKARVNPKVIKAKRARLPWLEIIQDVQSH